MEDFYVDTLDASAISIHDPEIAYNGFYTTFEWFSYSEVDDDDSTTVDHIS